MTSGKRANWRAQVAHLLTVQRHTGQRHIHFSVNDERKNGYELRQRIC